MGADVKALRRRLEFVRSRLANPADGSPEVRGFWAAEADALESAVAALVLDAEQRRQMDLDDRVRTLASQRDRWARAATETIDLLLLADPAAAERVRSRFPALDDEWTRRLHHLRYRAKVPSAEWPEPEMAST